MNANDEMIKFGYMVFVVCPTVFDLAQRQGFDFVDDYLEKIIVVLRLVTPVDKMYLDEVHLLLVDHEMNTIIANELNDTIRRKISPFLNTNKVDFLLTIN